MVAKVARVLYLVTNNPEDSRLRSVTPQKTANTDSQCGAAGDPLNVQKENVDRVFMEKRVSGRSPELTATGAQRPSGPNSG